MRKLIAVLAAGALLAAPVAPASAGKKGKRVHGSIEATLAPLPNLSSVTHTERPGCAAGVEGVHWAGKEFTAPGAGSLRFYTEGFTGDHDLYVFAGTDAPIARSDNAQVPDGAAPEEEIVLPIKKGQKVTLVVYNWFGHPEVAAHYEGVFK